MKDLCKTALIFITAALIPGTAPAGQWRQGDGPDQGRWRYENDDSAWTKNGRVRTRPAGADGEGTGETEGEEAMIPVTIQVEDQTFEASLFDNEAARALAAQLPMTVSMSELNRNEKYYYLPSPLPAAPEGIGSIRAGDLMLFGSDCLVLFYEDFDTSYRYTRLGAVTDPAGLARALGSGSVTVSFGLAVQ